MATIIIDMDNVLVNLNERWFGDFNREHGDTHGFLHPKDMKGWYDVEKTPIGKDIYKYLHQPNFFAELAPYPGAVEAVNKFIDVGHEIVIATACLDAQFAKDKEKWCQQHLPRVPRRNIAFLSCKERLKGDVFIDDSPHNIEAYSKAWNWSEAAIATIAFPYNEEVKHLVACYAQSYEDPAKAWNTIEKWVLDVHNY